MKHMVPFSEQKNSNSTQNIISAQIESQQILERMCSFCLYAPDATTVA